MKRISGLFDSIAERTTLSVAVQRAAQGKRSRREVRRFIEEFDLHSSQIVRALHEGSFQFLPYRQFYVRDTKTRLIHAPPFRDRVVHHAMIHITGPIFEQAAYYHSYACRAGKGQHAAIAIARKWSRRTDWFLKLDVEKFYDSIDHEYLRLLLRRRFCDQRLLKLLDKLIHSYAAAPGKGLPIGALTSQYLGNFYLDTLDRWAKQTMRAKYYVRYMDDFVFWGTRTELRILLARIGPFLEAMRLKANDDVQLNRCELGLPFLGFTIYPNRLRLNRAGKRRLRRKLRDLDRKLVRGICSEQEYQDRSCALFAHAAVADDVGWRRAVLRDKLEWES